MHTIGTAQVLCTYLKHPVPMLCTNSAGCVDSMYSKFTDVHKQYWPGSPVFHIINVVRVLKYLVRILQIASVCKRCVRAKAPCENSAVIGLLLMLKWYCGVKFGSSSIVSVEEPTCNWVLVLFGNQAHKDMVSNYSREYSLRPAAAL